MGSVRVMTARPGITRKAGRNKGPLNPEGLEIQDTPIRNATPPRSRCSPPVGPRHLVTPAGWGHSPVSQGVSPRREELTDGADGVDGADTLPRQPGVGEVSSTKRRQPGRPVREPCSEWTTARDIAVVLPFSERWVRRNLAHLAQRFGSRDLRFRLDAVNTWLADYGIGPMGSDSDAR